MSRISAYLWLGLIGVVGFCMLLPSPDNRGLVEATLLLGWLVRLREMFTEHEARWFVIAVIGVIAVTTAAVHGIGVWFRGKNGWSRKRSVALAGLLTLLALAGIAAVNVTHNATILFELPRWQVDLNRIRTQKHVNMQNIGLGLLLHHDAEKQFPFGGTFDTQGRAMHAWQTMILPYTDQAALYQQIDMSEPWTSPRHRPVFSTTVAIYRHPLAEEHNTDGYALTSYAGNIRVLGGKRMKLKEITDGAANTILLGEVVHNLKPWGMAMNSRDPALGLDHSEGFGVRNGPGVAMVMADGSVRWLAKDTDPNILKALATPNGGEGAKAHEFPD